MLRHSPVCMFHTRNVLSSDPLHSLSPHCNKQLTQLVCPLSVLLTSPGCSHSRISPCFVPMNREEEPLTLKREDTVIFSNFWSGAETVGIFAIISINYKVL